MQLYELMAFVSLAGKKRVAYGTHIVSHAVKELLFCSVQFNQVYNLHISIRCCGMIFF